MQVQFAFRRLRVGRARHKIYYVWFYVSKLEKKKVLYLKSPKVLLKKYISFIKIGTQNDFLFCYTVSCLKTRRYNVCLVVVVDVAETYLKMRKLERKWLTISGTMIMPARRLTSFPCFPTFKSQKWTFHSHSWMQFPRLAIRK